MGADGPSLALAAHSLKSSSLSVGAIGVGSLCAELEQIGRNNTLHKAGDLLSRAEAQYAAVHAAFIDALQQSGE
jgi:HPt (histidine-containing phosphotransfer) domain-containing protein